MYTKALPPFLLGETEWPDAITSGDLLFWIPIQEAYVSGTPTDITGNYTISDWRTEIATLDREFKLVYDASFDAVNLLLNELFWDDATKTPKWIDHKSLGTNYLGKNLLFQCTTGEPWSDLVLFATPRNSSTSPSIEQVAGTLQLTPGDIITFGGSTFTFGGRPIRF
jgi:hypothetical protein